MATTTEGRAGPGGAGGRLSSLHITLPFSVVQVWNDLEVGQVVKLPATDSHGEWSNLGARENGSGIGSLWDGSTGELDWRRPAGRVVG